MHICSSQTHSSVEILVHIGRIIIGYIINPLQTHLHPTWICVRLCVLALLCFRRVNLARVILIKSQNAREIEKKMEPGWQPKTEKAATARNWIWNRANADESDSMNVRHVLHYYINLNVWNSLVLGFFIDVYYSSFSIQCRAHGDFDALIPTGINVCSIVLAICASLGKQRAKLSAQLHHSFITRWCRKMYIRMEITSPNRTEPNLLQWEHIFRQINKSNSITLLII